MTEAEPSHSTLIQGRYYAEQRNRNRFTIVATTCLLLALMALIGLLANRSLADVAVGAVAIVAFAALFWWLFGSRKAGPVRLSDSSVKYMQSVNWWDPVNPWKWAKREPAEWPDNAGWSDNDEARSRSTGADPGAE